MWVVDRGVLKQEIDKKSAAIDAATRGRTHTQSWDEAVYIGRLCAEHDALVTVFNCLVERKSIWDEVR